MTATHKSSHKMDFSYSITKLPAGFLLTIVNRASFPWGCTYPDFLPSQRGPFKNFQAASLPPDAKCNSYACFVTYVTMFFRCCIRVFFLYSSNSSLSSLCSQHHYCMLWSILGFAYFTWGKRREWLLRRILLHLSYPHWSKQECFNTLIKQDTTNAGTPEEFGSRWWPS